jgi:2-oxoglutarate dehydrogenase complex dehydrogenase (E1) component-like enzyme
VSEDDEGKQGELVPVRRQRAVRRGAVRGLSRQSRLRPRQVALVLRRAAERPRDRRHDARDMAHAPVVESFAQRAKANAFGNRASSEDLAIARKQVYVQSLIAAYRSLGSRWADLDPLKRQERPKIPELEPAFYDLSEADMDMVFSATNTYFTTDEQMTLRQIVQALRETYCGTIGTSTCTAPSRPRSAGGSSGSNRSARSPLSRPKTRSTSSSG